MLSVKVRLPQRSLLHGFVPPPRRGFLHFLAFVCSPGANHLLLLFPPERLFPDFFRLGSFILLVCLVNVRVDAAACVDFGLITRRNTWF